MLRFDPDFAPASKGTDVYNRWCRRVLKDENHHTWSVPPPILIDGDCYYIYANAANPMGWRNDALDRSWKRSGRAYKLERFPDTVRVCDPACYGNHNFKRWITWIDQPANNAIAGRVLVHYLGTPPPKARALLMETAEPAPAFARSEAAQQMSRSSSRNLTPPGAQPPPPTPPPPPPPQDLFLPDIVAPFPHPYPESARGEESTFPDQADLVASIDALRQLSTGPGRVFSPTTPQAVLIPEAHPAPGSFRSRSASGIFHPIRNPYDSPRRHREEQQAQHHPHGVDSSSMKGEQVTSLDTFYDWLSSQGAASSPAAFIPIEAAAPSAPPPPPPPPPPPAATNLHTMNVTVDPAEEGGPSRQDSQASIPTTHPSANSSRHSTYSRFWSAPSFVGESPTPFGSNELLVTEAGLHPLIQSLDAALNSVGLADTPTARHLMDEMNNMAHNPPEEEGVTELPDAADSVSTNPVPSVGFVLMAKGTGSPGGIKKHRAAVLVYRMLQKFAKVVCFLDSTNKTSHWVVTLVGEVEDMYKGVLENLHKTLERITGDAKLEMSVISGSIILYMRGTLQGFLQVEHMFRTGRLRSLCGFRVAEVMEVDRIEMASVDEGAEVLELLFRKRILPRKLDDARIVAVKATTAGVDSMGFPLSSSFHASLRRIDDMCTSSPNKRGSCGGNHVKENVRGVCNHRAAHRDTLKSDRKRDFAPCPDGKSSSLSTLGRRIGSIEHRCGAALDFLRSILQKSGHKDVGSSVLLPRSTSARTCLLSDEEFLGNKADATMHRRLCLALRAVEERLEESKQRQSVDRTVEERPPFGPRVNSRAYLEGVRVKLRTKCNMMAEARG